MTHETAGEYVLSSCGISSRLGLRRDCCCRRNNRRCERQSMDDPTHCLAHDHLPLLSRCEEIERANALHPVQRLEYFSMTETVDGVAVSGEPVLFHRPPGKLVVLGTAFIFLCAIDQL